MKAYIDSHLINNNVQFPHLHMEDEIPQKAFLYRKI